MQGTGDVKSFNAVQMPVPDWLLLAGVAVLDGDPGVPKNIALGNQKRRMVRQPNSQHLPSQAERTGGPLPFTLAEMRADVTQAPERRHLPLLRRHAHCGQRLHRSLQPDQPRWRFLHR